MQYKTLQLVIMALQLMHCDLCLDIYNIPIANKNAGGILLKLHLYQDTTHIKTFKFPDINFKSTVIE